MKSVRSLSSSSWSKLNQLWRKRKRSGAQASQREALRLEFLENRDVFAAGDYNPASAFSFSAQLDIFVNGVRQTIPANVGKNVAVGDNNELFTNDTSNKINIAFTAGARAANDFVKLDEFFDRWRRDTVNGNTNALFSSTNILGNVADASHVVRFYVNGKENSDFQNYQVRNEDDIVISYETRAAADAPTILPIQDVTVLAGSPLYLPLLGFDPDNQTLTFTATSSNTSVLTTYIPQNNPTLKMTVADFGDMVFQLFQDKAPRPAERVATLANQGFYDGIIFHRVIPTFVLQAGDPTGTGTSGSSLGNFDDQFNVDLQHNRTGLLSFAKSSDDTNNSQFFITENPQRHLDGNHSIFGMLLTGENVREMISQVPTNSSDKPLTNVVISSADMITDNKVNTLMLKAPNGATGTSDVTVTVTDSSGKTFQQTFRVTVAADTNNTPPFMTDIPAISVLADQTSTFQLPAVDVEGDAINYTIQKSGSQTNYTLSVNSTTGLVTVTPPAGFTGTLQAIASVRRAVADPNDGTVTPVDTQLFNITVAANRIPTIDLDAASDTGSVDNDNLTNAASLTFNLGGLQSGDVVRLFDGTTQVGEQTASGANATITLTNVAEGIHNYTARAVINGVVGAASPVLAVTVDRTGPAAIDTTAPVRATATEAYSYNAHTPDEENGLVRYSLTGAPIGMTIDIDTGVVSWTPTAQQTGTQTYTVVATDPAGNTVMQAVSLSVNAFQAAQAEIALDILDLSGNVITSIAQGGEFFIRARVRDLTDPPSGINTFATDVTYDAAKIATTSAGIVFGTGSNLSALSGGSKDTPGLLDEVGALDSTFTRSNSGEFVELFRLRLKAVAAGPALFQADPADTTRMIVSVFASPDAIDPLAIRYGTATLNVQPSVTAVADQFSVREESTANSLDVLANDSSLLGSSTLIVQSVGTSSAGATITRSSDNKRILYTPANNFVGQDTFTYVVSDGTGSVQTTVTVNVTNENDPPVAVNDTFTVDEDSSGTLLTVLQNDNSGVDVGETLRVTAVGTPSNGGTVTIVQATQGVTYTPAKDFFGTETFTYTLSDGNGGTATATVSVTVTAKNDDPTANIDSLTVQEDSTSVTINVLSNDSGAPDAAGETLTITAVGTPTRGGTVTIASDGKSVIYTPAANFQGSETFTYTISDGNGGTATAAVNVLVSNTNDPPVGVNDTVTGFKNSTDYLFNTLLNNDTSGTDPAENLVISAVAAGSAGGTLKVSTDGKGVLYTPARDFVGTETFVYTLRDPGGLTSTATVTVDVQNFVPSKFSGKVFIDNNSNGAMDASESPLSNVLVTLSGKDTSNQTVTLTTLSKNDGGYLFENLAPGTYTITQTQPTFLIDGAEIIGTAGGTAGADSFTITLAENTNATGYHFSEMGTPPKNVRVTDLFARRQRNFVTAAVSNSGSTFTQIAGESWRYYASTALTLDSAANTLRITATDFSAQQYTATVPLSNSAMVQDLGSENGSRFLKILGTPTELNLQPITVSANAPKVITTSASVNYTEDGSLVIDDGLLLSDPDSTTLASATVAITSNYSSGNDLLEFTNSGGISGSFNATTGTLTLTGSASLSAYQAALRTVRFRNTSNAPSVAGRTISFTASDGSNTSAAATRLVTITLANDAPIVTASGGSTSYLIGNAAVPVDPAVTLTDADNSTLASATVKITGGYQNGVDLLEFAAANGITSSFQNGELTLTGNASVANYQAALRAVTFRTNGTNANTAVRTITFTANDGSATNGQSAATTKSVSVTETPNSFNVNASAANNTVVGTVTPPTGMTGALTYELNNSTQDARLSIRPDDHLSGNLNGSLIMIEYLNLQCPHCKEFYPIVEAMKQQFPELLLVQRYFRIDNPLSLGDEAAAAAEAAGKQGKFQEMVQKLFDEQNNWSPLANANAAADPTLTFEQYATDLGLNLTTFRADYAAGTTKFASDSDAAVAMGVNAAPTFFINGVQTANPSPRTNEAFAAVLQPKVDALANVFNINHTTGQITVRDRTLLAGASPKTMQIRVTNSAGTSQVVNVTVNVNANTAPVVGLSAGNVAFAEGGTAVVVDPLATVSDADSATLTGATIRIATGYQAGQDTLTYTAPSGVNITGSFNSTTGTMSLTGNASPADYQLALRAVGFNNASQAPTAGNRSIEFIVTDGSLSSTAASRTVAVTAINDAPTITLTSSPLEYTENDSLVIDAGLALADLDSTNLTGATVTVLNGSTPLGSEDELLFTDQNGITGTYSSTTGQLSLTGSASVAAYQTALQSVRYRNKSEFPTTTQRTVQFVVSDGGTENSLSTTATQAINLTAVNDAPIMTASTSTLNYTGGSTAVSVDTLVTVNELEENNITGGKVKIAAGYVNGSDVLSATEMHGITFSFNASTGELTLTGTATFAQYQQFLRSVTFSTTAGSVASSSRTISFEVTDNGAPAATSNVVSRTVSVENGPTGEAGDDFFASLGENTPSVGEEGGMSNDEFSNTADDFYSLLGE